MKTLGKVALIALLLVLFLVAGAWGAGALLPEEHSAARTILLQQPREKIWATITDYASAPQWRLDLEKVERSHDAQGREVWVERSKEGDSIPYATLESSPPSRLVREIADPELPFGGTWTFELQEESGKTRVTITENGSVPNPIVRLISKYLIGHTTFMERYLTALGEKFDERITPLPVT